MSDQAATPLRVMFTDDGAETAKAILGQPGWAFLANDTNDFLAFLFGTSRWTPAEEHAAISTLRDRAAWVRSQGAAFFRFAIPEKSAIYPNYLPTPLHEIPVSENRPAEMLARRCGDIFSYPAAELRQALRIQHTYFRADSHPNWFGALIAYRAIAARMAEAGLVDKASILTLGDLLPSFAAYNGDLLPNLSDADRTLFLEQNAAFTTQHGFESLMMYRVHPHRARARIESVPEPYVGWFRPRPQHRTVVDDARLPKAVVFRDSTSDFMWPLLAEHFREALFIWHKGAVFREVVEAEKPDVVLQIQAERFLQTDPVRAATLSAVTDA